MVAAMQDRVATRGPGGTAAVARPDPACRPPARSASTPSATRPAALPPGLVPAVLLAVLLASCATGPGDGPPRDRPRGLEASPDAEPRIEPLRSGGPNRPYEQFGRRYVPETRDLPMREEGLASWYGRKFHGRTTASGERYDMYAMTAAHKTMPLPSYARVRNRANGREIVVRVNDRGPFVAGRVIDLSYAAAQKLGVRGLAPVEVERLTFEAIRTGAWRHGQPAAPKTATLEPAGPEPAVPEPSTREPAALEPVVAMAGGAPAAAVLPARQEAVTATPASANDIGAQPLGFWVQLGAFREPGGAEDFRRQVSTELDWLAPLMAVFSDAPLFRLQAGPYASRGEAQDAAQRVREALRLVPVILERR